MAESTRAMAQRLLELPGQLDLRQARSMNRERVEALEQIPTPTDLAGRLDFQRLYAGELFRAGDLDAAEPLFEELMAEVDALTGRIAPAYRRSIVEFRVALLLRRVALEDCVIGDRQERCVFPVVDEGQAGTPEYLQRAIQIMEPELEANVGVRDGLLLFWLYNLAHRMAGSWPDGVAEAYRIDAPFSADPSVPHFEDVARRLGVDVEGQAGGAILDDFTGDGLLDLMTSSFHFTDQLQFFVNRGDGTFRPATDEAGLTGLVGGLQMRQADYDNDGDLDVFVLRGGWEKEQGQPNSLIRNNGDGTFDDVTEAAGVLEYGPTATASWGDYDNDGWVDLFVGAEAELRSRPPRAHPSRLFRNNRDGTFTDVSGEVGLDSVGFVKGAVWGDYDNDGWPDLYLARFDEPNLLLRNPGGWPGGRFEDVSEEAGVQEPIGSLPAWFWDYDNDGWLDILALSYGFDPWEEVADVMGLQYFADTPHLYRNRGDGTFEDVTASVGLDRVFYTMGSEFGDLDNDGFLDFYAGTGMPAMSVLFPNRVFRNRAGQSFEDVSAAGFAYLAKGHGGAFGDLDEDGDQDVYMVLGGANQGDRQRNVLFANPGNDNAWITLRLEGRESNRSAIGARVEVRTDGPDGPQSFHRAVGMNGSFGGSSLQEEIGLGRAERIVSIEVWWPTTGEREVFSGAELRSAYRIVEGTGALERVTLRPTRLGGAP